MKKRILDKFIIRADNQYDLNDWREWFSKNISLIFSVLYPLTFIYLFPVYMERGLYYVITIDLLLWVYILLRAFAPWKGVYSHNFIWLILFYSLTISFYLTLGPGYARPAWFMLCTVIAAIFYGVNGALISSAFNAVMLIALFFSADSSIAGWSAVHDEGLKNWLMFTGNFTLITLSASVSIGFLIHRLNKSLHIERNTKEELQATNEELTAALEEMEAINEAFEAQNNDLIKTSNALRNSEIDLKEIFNSTYDAFIVHDINGRIYDVNTRMLEMFKMSRDEALSMNISDISAPGIDISGIAKSWQWITDGKTLMFEWKSLRPSDNSTFDTEVALRKLNLQGREVMLSSLRDLTERKKAESENQLIQSQLVQAQKMEAVGTLASGIAHDFNNVLGGIIGSLSILEILLKEENLKEHREIAEYMQIAVESSKRAADITKQLLMLSKKHELRMAPVLIMNSINNVMKICKSSFPKLVKLNFLPADESLRVLADPTQIEQVLLNLCMNASHSMTIMRKEGEHQGGMLTLETGEIICDAKFSTLHPESVTGSSYIKIRISDTGVGMDEERLKRIFEPFFTTKGHNEGTGLGLAITYTIIMQHKGFIDVSSEPGKGSVFTVYLPRFEKTSDYSSSEYPERVTGSGRILVVDDEENMLLIARGILKQCGYTVVTADNASLGIELFSNPGETFDAVVIDNSMPYMSGLDVYLAMCSAKPGIRTMLTSGFIDEETIAKCRRNGILEFINKPYNAEEFSVKMHNLMNMDIEASK